MSKKVAYSILALPAAGAMLADFDGSRIELTEYTALTITPSWCAEPSIGMFGLFMRLSRALQRAKALGDFFHHWH